MAVAIRVRLPVDAQINKSIEGVILRLPRLPVLQPDGNKRDYDDKPHDRQDILVNVGNDGAEIITEEGNDGCPREAADEVEEEVGPVAHLRNAGKDRGEGADDGNEAREDDGLRTVRIEKGMGPLDVLAPEKERLVAVEHGGAEPTPEKISEVVAGDGSGEEERDEDPDIEIMLRREEARGKEQAVARQEESDEQTRFGEDDTRETEIAERMDERDGVKREHALV